MAVLQLHRSTSHPLAVAPKSFFGLNRKAPFGRLFFAQIFGVLGAVLWIISWLNPNHYPPWIVFENEACTFAALICASVALLIVRGSRPFRVPLNPLLWIFAITVIVAIQFGISMISQQQAFLGSLYLVGFALSFIVGCQAFATANDRHHDWEVVACFAILLTALLCAGVVLIQYFDVDDAYPVLVASRGVFRPFGNLGQPNNQATFLAMAIVCMDLLARQRKIQILVGVAAALTLITALSATGSRAGLAGALCAAICLQWDGAKGEGKFTSMWAISLLGSFILMPELNRLFHLQPWRGGAELLSDNPRLLIYSQLTKALFVQPWTGYGFGNTGYAQSMIALDAFAGMPVSNAHNLPLELLIWFGVPIGLVLVGGAAILAVSIRKNCLANHSLLYCIVIPFVTHSLLELPYTYSFFLLTSGLIVGYVSMGSQITQTLKSSKVLMSGLTLYVGLCGYIVLFDYVHLSESFTLARFESRKLGALPKAHVSYQSRVLKDMNGMLDATRITPTKDLHQDAVEDLSMQALTYHIPLAHIKLIWYLLAAENSKKAEEEIKRFKHLYAPDIRRWGLETLQSDFCPDDKASAPLDWRCNLIRSYLP